MRAFRHSCQFASQFERFLEEFIVGMTGQREAMIHTLLGREGTTRYEEGHRSSLPNPARQTVSKTGVRNKSDLRKREHQPGTGSHQHEVRHQRDTTASACS